MVSFQFFYYFYFYFLSHLSLSDHHFFKVPRVHHYHKALLKKYSVLQSVFSKRRGRGATVAPLCPNVGPSALSLSLPFPFSLEHTTVFRVADLTQPPLSHDSHRPPLLNSWLISPAVADYAPRSISPSWLLPNRRFISTFFFFFWGFILVVLGDGRWLWQLPMVWTGIVLILF